MSWVQDDPLTVEEQLAMRRGEAEAPAPLVAPEREEANGHLFFAGEAACDFCGCPYAEAYERGCVTA